MSRMSLAGALSALALTSVWAVPAWTLTLAASVLLPAWLLGRGDDDGSRPDGPDDEGGGGGGGGPRRPPEPPDPPPGSGLDWGAFDEARERWAAREREPVAS